MEGMKANAGAAKPVTDLANVLPFGVVEVAARRENLDGLRATGDELVEQAGMQPLSSCVHQS